MREENKKCPFCGGEIKKEGIQCRHCSERLGESHKEDMTTFVKKYSGKTSATKFIILDLATFGVYSLIWIYRQWCFLKNKQNLKISPGWRSILAPFWTGLLAFEIKKLLKEKNISVSFSPNVVGASYFIFIVLWELLPAPYQIVSLLSFIPLLPLVESMNEYYGETEHGLIEMKLRWWQKVLTGIGLFLLMLSVCGAFYPN